MENLLQMTQHSPYFRSDSSVDWGHTHLSEPHMKREIFDIETATETIFEKLGIQLPTRKDQQKAKDVRIPNELLDNDMFFGA